MPRRLLFALLVLVAAPLMLLGWLSASTYQEQQRQAREQLGRFFQSRLSEIDRSLQQVFEGYERLLRSRLEDRSDIAKAIRELELEEPIVRSSIYVNKNEFLLHPPKPQPEQDEKVALFAALPAIVRGRPELGPIEADRSNDIDAKPVQTIGPGKAKLPEKVSPDSPSKAADPVEQKSSNVLTPELPLSGKAPQLSPSQLAAPSQLADSSPFSAPSQLAFQTPIPRPQLIGEGKWQVWYMDEGVQLIYWMQLTDGSAIGVLLERVRWIADLTASLPETNIGPSGDSTREIGLPTDGPRDVTSTNDPSYTSGFTALADEASRTVYRWGDNGPRDQPPLATRNLSAPLSSWRLDYHSRDPLAGAPSTAFLVASLVGIGLMLLSLGVYVLTAVQRQMRSARQRVSFASQVSHELRTPLTNIRLYAELAERDLNRIPDDETRQSVGRRLQVIDTESRRLGRLVSGVLEMIRDPRKQRQPRIAPVVADDVIDQTLTQFEPSFDKAQVVVDRTAEANECLNIDADILELILVNLLSNVEKYAASGGHVSVRSKVEGEYLQVDVFDQGPGIPWHQRKRIFRPFIRLDDSIQAPSGTGIGLTIARKLAQRHGGDLALTQDADHRGACFRLHIRHFPKTHGDSFQGTGASGEDLA